VCRSLKERSLASHVCLLVNDIDDLREVWNTLDTCYDRPDKYISEALDPVVRFRSYKAFDSGALWNKPGIILRGGRLYLDSQHATFIANFQQVPHFFGVPHRIQI
jgi:hypothetical protein